MNEKLPFGLKQKPYGYPLMMDAFIGCVSHCISVGGIRDDFKKKTGHDLSSLARSSGINLMIDKASGYQKEVMESFFNYVNENHWGLDENPETQEDIGQVNEYAN